MSYEPLHHKYRPQTFADLVGQEMIANTLSNALSQEKIATAYLFTGPRGTGKTSSARILAKSLNCLESNQPTPTPCGKCEACLAIAKGTALDVIEIDAASNTGVDNIREIIERSRFAPVQCRYKVYAIDECLTGDSLIITNEGLMRIDNPNLKGKIALSYNENTESWEHKRVLRWLERGTKETLIVKTSNRQICCTKNHLIRTETGWIEAKNVKEGMKILSPANVALESFDIQRDFLNEKIKLLPIGLQTWDILLAQNLTQENLQEKFTTTSRWGQNQVKNGCQTCNNIQFSQWTTNLEEVESVRHAGHEKVYDLEVEDNHNFVANGLLVHNCHMLSTAAFNALLKTLEEPPPNVVFILATTDPQRVLSTIISRCQRFDYRRIPLGEMVAHLKYIAQSENIKVTDEAITLIAQIANGGLRDAESLLDQLSLLPDQITVEKVWDLVGAVSERDLLALLQAIRSDRPELVLQCCRNLLDRGREPLVVLQNLAGFYLNLLIAKTAPHLPDLVAVTETCWQELCTEAANWEPQLILRGQQQLKDAETQLKNTTQPRLWLEVTLLSLLAGLNSTAIAAPTSLATITSSSQPSNRSTQADPIAKSPAYKPPAPPVEEVNAVRDSKAIPESYELATQLPTASLSNATNHSSPEPLDAGAIDIKDKVSSLATAKANAADSSAVAKLTENQTKSQIAITPASDRATSHQASPVNQDRSHHISDPIANKQLWEQVIACLHPPTTKALLSQQCHLVSFNGSSAVVGISSAKLQKLHQAKVTNIEAAFAQVCQSKVKVSLEVATATTEAVTSPSITENQSIAPPQESPSEATSLGLSPVVPPPDTILPPKTPVNSQTAISKHSQATSRTKTQLKEAPANIPQTHLEVPAAQPLNIVESALLETELAADALDLGEQNAPPDVLQRAIESLTHSFEGEVVELEDKVFAAETVEEIVEIDNAPLPGNITLGNRPDLSKYDDDDDVPF